MVVRNIKWDTDGDKEVFDSLPQEGYKIAFPLLLASNAFVRLISSIWVSC